MEQADKRVQNAGSENPIQYLEGRSNCKKRGKNRDGSVQMCCGNVTMHEFLLQDPKRLHEVKWRMSCVSSQPLIPDMTVSQKRWEKGGRERKRGREGEPDRHKCPGTKM